MGDTEGGDTRGAPLIPGVHRVVRVLDTKEGPFAGTLVTRGDGVAVRVGTAILAGWKGWAFAGSEHVAAPLDVSRCRGGHDVLLPWCTETVTLFLIRRRAGGNDLSAGERTTLIISLLRGIDELGGDENGHEGKWWLTDGGRPLFVFGVGTEARAGVSEILDQMESQSTDKLLNRTLGAVQSGLAKAAAQPRVPRRLLEAWEQELLDVAAPQPLVRDSHAPELARDVARAVAPRPVTSESDERGLRVRRSRGAGRKRTAGHGTSIGRVLTKSGSAVLHGVRVVIGARDRRLSRSLRGESKPAVHGRRSRMRVVAIAATAGAAVLIAGLLWPDADADVIDTKASRTAAPTAAPPETQDGAESNAVDLPAETTPPAEESPTQAVPRLLNAISACREKSDSACAAAIAGEPSGVIDALASVNTDSATAALVDQYGDVAVVRLATTTAITDEAQSSSGDAVELMIVLVRSDEKWLIRDVYNVADQPD